MAADPFNCRRPLPGFESLAYMSLMEAERAGAGPLSRLPYCLRVLADSLLRHGAPRPQIEALAAVGADPLLREDPRYRGISLDFHPERLLMQDSSGLPVLADIAALAEATDGNVVRMRADLVVDHAVEVDHWGTSDAAARNIEAEFCRHASRYGFLKWAERRFPWLRVTPPGVGICHQLNLEVFADLVGVEDGLAGCDTLLGTDSHTTMINALSVFGWGVGGIEATSVLLGSPVALPVPRVVGVRLIGTPTPGVTATDLALSLTATLRSQDLVGRIVEFCGPGIAALAVPDRATIANMAPEYGATMGFFPADERTLAYLRTTGRNGDKVVIADRFLRAQGLLWSADALLPVFEGCLDFDLSTVAPTIAGPSRPDQKLSLGAVPDSVTTGQKGKTLQDGDIVIAAITSCTNTSNPRLLAAAGLLAEKAVARGMKSKPWVKTSLAPGSQIAAGMLVQAGLQAPLDALGFSLVAYGCTTCMGNSGPLAPELAADIEAASLSVAAVLSGNRNFEGRVHAGVRLAYLMSPPLVVAYALAGSVKIDLARMPLGQDSAGRPVHLAELWPGEEEIDAALARADLRSLALNNRDGAFDGPAAWQSLAVPEGERYPWEDEAGFIRLPPFLEPQVARPLLGRDIVGARALVVLDDAVTTDHISPVSAIPLASAAGTWLAGRGVPTVEFASFSARRLNHDVMLRGGFANPRLRNRLADGREGGVTRLLPDGELMPIHEAAARYAEQGVPLIVLAGQRYGAGSARDWAAKVTRLLGVSAVIAEGFERIHRTNLTAMGVLPLRIGREDRQSLIGMESFDIIGLPDQVRPGGKVELVVHGAAESRRIPLTCQIETEIEALWLRDGGVLAGMLKKGNR